MLWRVGLKLDVYLRQLRKEWRRRGGDRPCDDEEDGCLCGIVFFALSRTRMVEVSWSPGIDKTVSTLSNKGFSIVFELRYSIRTKDDYSCD